MYKNLLTLFASSLILMPLTSSAETSEPMDLNSQEMQEISEMYSDGTDLDYSKMTDEEILKLNLYESELSRSELLQQAEVAALTPQNIIDILIDLLNGRDWTCVSRNLRGHRFTGHADTRKLARRRAMRNCRNVSKKCNLVRCSR